jgi:hypothetical protein
MDPRNHYTADPLVITRNTWATSPWGLIPASTIKNTSKNRKNTNKTALITRWGLTNWWKMTLFDKRYDLSKKPNPTVAMAIVKIEVRGMHNPWKYP